MKVALYHPWIYLKSGLERTILELKRGSRHDWSLFTGRFDADNTYPELRDMDVVELAKLSTERRYSAVLGAARTIFSTKVDLDRFDALVISCEGLGNLINFRNHSKPLMCLCFTPLRAVYDEAYRERHLAKHRRIRPIALACEAAFRLIDRRAWKYYDDVVCISETVKRRVIAGGLYPAERIGVAYPGIHADTIRGSDTRDNYFFLPGRIMWTKNIELAIDSFRRLKASGPAQDFELVIAGMVDRKSEPYYAQLRARAGGDAAIRFEIGPSDTRMQDLYRRCHTLLFTAFNEDWGLTPIEAMVYGKPVVAVNRGGPTEVVADGESGLLVANDPAAYTEAMGRLVDEAGLAERFGAVGLERAQLFTWERFVAGIDSRLDTLADSQRQ